MKYVIEINSDEALDTDQFIGWILDALPGLFPSLKITDITNEALPGQYPLTFEKFWKTYMDTKIPAGSKRNAYKAWYVEGIDRKGELFLDALCEHVATHAKRYHACVKRNVFYPPLLHAERFLKRAMWEGEPPPMPDLPYSGRPDGL